MFNYFMGEFVFSTNFVSLSYRKLAKKKNLGFLFIYFPSSLKFDYFFSLFLGEKIANFVISKFK